MNGRTVATAGCLLLPADCLLPTTFQKLLRLVQPAFFQSILVSGRRLDGIDAGLHQTSRLAAMTQAGVCSSHQIKTFGIRLTAFQKTLQRRACIVVLSGGIIGSTDLTP